MFFGLFKSKPKVVTVKRKRKAKETTKPKQKKPKIKKSKARKRVTPAKKRKAVVKKRVTKKVRKVSRVVKTMPQIVGKVTHYFPHVKAGVILVTDGTLALGDTVYIKGHTTDFKQKVKSMQINNVPIKEAGPGQEAGILLKSRVRHNDVVYKL